VGQSLNNIKKKNLEVYEQHQGEDLGIFLDHSCQSIEETKETINGEQVLESEIK